MSIEVVSIGDELLAGYTANTNLVDVGTALAGIGLQIARESCVPDAFEALVEVLRGAIARADLVLTIGGLGPTEDDLTRPAVAAALGVPYSFSAAAEAHAREALEQRGKTCQPGQLDAQSCIPDGAEVLPNRAGVAPGLWCSHGGTHICTLPGPPGEFRSLLAEQVLPRVRELFAPRKRERCCEIVDIGEPTIAKRVGQILPQYPGVQAAYCVSSGVTSLRLSALVDCKHLDVAMDAVLADFGQAALAVSLPEALQDLLEERGERFAVAESCTGGGIGKRITDLPGSSAIFAGGIISYSNELKQALLGVPAQTLEAHGAVSAQTAEAMVRGLCTRLEVPLGIAVTGVAGPGTSQNKPVGLVFIATCVHNEVRVQERHLGTTRAGVRERTITLALNQLRTHILTGA